MQGEVTQCLSNVNVVKISVYYEESIGMPCLQIYDGGVNDVTSRAWYQSKMLYTGTNNDTFTSKLVPKRYFFF